METILAIEADFSRAIANNTDIIEEKCPATVSSEYF
jgi:hypothetical protein